MNRMRSGSHTIAGAFVFLLLGIFALFSVILVLLSAGAYNRVTEASERNNQARIAPSYLRTMVRGHDVTDGIRTEHLAGILREDEDSGETSVEQVALDALVLDDEAAITRLFVYDGWLYECSEPKDEEPEEEIPADVCLGSCMSPVTEADEMVTELKDGLLILRLRTNDQWTELACVLHMNTP